MPVALLPNVKPPEPRNPADPYWKQALTVLKNAVTDPALDVMGTSPIAVGTAIAKAPRAIGGMMSMQDEMMRALRGARTVADDVVGVVDEASQLGPRINASGESAATMESRSWATPASSGMAEPAAKDAGLRPPMISWATVRNRRRSRQASAKTDSTSTTINR